MSAAEADVPDDASGMVPVPSLAGGRRQLHLTGFMGAGKSTVGSLLARRLVWSFLDLDAVVVRHVGKTIPEIFAQDGEQAFRAAERHALRQVVQKPRTVVALGGGTLIDPSNRDVCRRAAVVVWLDCTVATLRRRLGEQPGARPLWDDPARFRELLEARLPGYRSADFVVAADDPADDVVEQVLRVAGPRR